MIQTKQPAETLVFAYDFAPQLGGQAITAITAVGSDPRGAGANLVEINRAIDTSTVRVEWQGGVDGESYLTTVRVTDAAGQSHEIDGEIWVREGGFAVPIGFAGRYVTVEQYVDTFGVQETTRLTDETRAGAVDGPKVEAAIQDSEDEVDGYVARRYALPLATTPRAISSIVKVLARERLHKTRPTIEVKAAADRARAQLREISTGLFKLLGLDSADVPASSDRSALTSGPVKRPSMADELADYNRLGRGSYCEPRWRQ